MIYKTKFTELVGCKYPIMQGGLGYLSKAELAAAVAEAGGLGTITSAQFDSVKDLQLEIRKAKGLTKKPIAINLNLFPGRGIDNEAVVDVVLEEGIRWVETSGRSPEAFLEKLHKGKVKVIHKVPGVRYAQHVEKMGVDMVSVVGFEGGGHPGMGEVTSMVLTRVAVKKVKIPVLLAGGVADGRGLLAALVLGASGVVMGTRFMATQECMMHGNVKKWWVEHSELDTMIIDRSIRSARRVMRNATAERVLGMQQLDTPLPEQIALMGGLMSKNLWGLGNLDQGVLSCGQCVGLIDDIPTVKELIDAMVSEAGEVLKELGGR